MRRATSEQAFIDAILDFDEDEVLEQLGQLREAGKSPVEVAEVARKAMEEVGRMFETKEIFLTELIIAGELLKVVMEELGFSPDKMADAGNAKATVVIGTVEGDVHDIGKNIVIGLLSSNGFRVVDLGVEVPAGKFVEAVEAYKPEILAMCGLLTIAYDSMKATIEALERAGVRDGLKVMVGGGATDEAVREYVGADAFGKAAVEAVEIANRWVAA
ncbi:MAG: cobalamin B12-binding domain-containing protein [Promethearchaeota archaeon]